MEQKHSVNQLRNESGLVVAACLGRHFLTNASAVERRLASSECLSTKQ